MQKLLILIELAKEGAHKKQTQVTSSELAERTDCSQQTAARWLGKLSEEGLIEREAGHRGQIVKLTSEGTEVVSSAWRDLNEAFGEFPEELKISGKLVSGSGEGRYYIEQDRYQKQFKEKLGFEPYPGTIDLELEDESLNTKERLENLQGKKIEGFSTEERSFGEVKCFPARIMGEKAAVTLPSRTHHEDNIIEIISEVKVREKYDLKDGDETQVEVKI